ncbi:Ribokinase [bacterium HR40]|nr:Ribokinase [bacterium HR40]
MLVVFGSINADLVFPVEHLPAAGETVLCPRFLFRHGGKGANQATAAARAGAKVLFAGCIGRDPWGAVLRAGLVEAGVDTSLLRESDQPSGTAVVMVAASGENAIVVAAGANGEATAAQVPDGLLGRETTVLCQNEVPLRESTALLARARARGARCLWNLAPATQLRSELLAEIDALLVNAAELHTVAGDRSGEAAERAMALHRQYGCAVVVTLGAEGALLAARGRLLHQPALAVDVVDTTGAGDAFAGVFAAALDRGTSWEAALAEAAVAGALACTAVGARSGQPDRAAILARLSHLPAARILEG